jgi:hypothetical protein
MRLLTYRAMLIGLGSVLVIESLEWRWWRVAEQGRCAMAFVDALLLACFRFFPDACKLCVNVSSDKVVRTR